LDGLGARHNTVLLPVHPTMSAATSTSSTTSSPVRVLSREPVQCMDASSLRLLSSPVRLGPLDQTVLPFVPIAVVFVYRRAVTEAQNDCEEPLPFERLRRALARLLDYYPHLTGRMAFNSEDKAPQIERLGSGAELLAAQCDQPLDSFAVAAPDDAPDAPKRLTLLSLPGEGNDLLAPFALDFSPEVICSRPLLTVQHTRFACGGVALGVRLLHSLCDADGFFQFARNLAELCRKIKAAGGAPQASLRLQSPPVTRSFMDDLAMTDEERHETLQFKPTVYALNPEAPKVASAPSADAAAVPAAAVGTDSAAAAVPVAAAPSPPPVVGRVLRFSAQELAALKAEASEGAQGPVTTFDALSAHLWQSVYRARRHLAESAGLSAAEAAVSVSNEFLTSVNYRGPSRLDLPEHYFPNVIFAPFFALPPEQLAEAPLATVAAAVHAGVRKLGREEALQSLRWVAAQPDKSRVRLGFQYEKGGFLVSQWTRFDMHAGMGLGDAGADQPVLVSSPFTPISLVDGLVYYLPTGAPSGGVEQGQDVNLALSEPAWHILDKDGRFRRHRNL